MLDPSEVNLKQRLFVTNFNLLAEVCTKLGEPIEEVNSTGLCDGLAKKRLFDAYQAKGGELPEFDAYMAYINGLTPKSIQALANRYKTNKNFAIGVVAGYELTFKELLKFAESVNQAQASQSISPFKSFAANWDDSLSFVCRKSSLPEFLTMCQFDIFDLLYFNTGDHGFAKTYSTIYDANNPKKAWVLEAGKTRAEQAAEVASIINEKIFPRHTQSDYVALSLNSLSYGNAHLELVDLLDKNRDIIQQQQPSLLSYIEDYERGKLSRMQLVFVLNEAMYSHNPHLIKFKSELSQICTQQTVTLENLITLAKGDINAQDSHGHSWLWLAASDNQITWVKALIKAGAKIDAHCNRGTTPLYIASQNGHLEIVKLLVANGAKIDLPPTSGVTPLCIALHKKHLEIAEFLLKSGADIDAVWSLDGSTPFHVAVYYGYIGMVTMLLEKGADINKPLKNGKTPLEIASCKGHTEIKQIIKQYKNAETVLLQAEAKIKLADSVAIKISKVFSAFAYPPLFSMIWRNGQEKKCAATIATQLLENPGWSFNDCKDYITTTVMSIEKDQWSVLTGLLKQLDKFAPGQAVSILENDPNDIKSYLSQI